MGRFSFFFFLETVGTEGRRAKAAGRRIGGFFSFPHLAVRSGLKYRGDPISFSLFFFLPLMIK